MKAIAYRLAEEQKEISVSEFFERNRHLLGFDNKRKALLMAVKEAVDNALDACEDARILPEIKVEIINLNEDKYKVVVEDNGPGIVKNQIPKIFGKLLYGSRFFKFAQSRGQQGIGISAACLYSQLTTGKAAKIISKIDENEPAHYFEILLDVQKNEPLVVKEEKIEWKKAHGTRIELELEGNYIKGDQSVDTYLKLTAIANPCANIYYTNPKAEQIIFTRVSEIIPEKAKAIKPHPYGVELGMLLKMLQSTSCRNLQSFLTNEFSRIGARTAQEICANALLSPKAKPQSLTTLEAERLIKAFGKTKIMAPSSECLSPIGAKELEKGLKKEIDAEFYCSTSRPPAVYRGIPFIIEAALAYGGSQSSEDQIRILRFVNRVPLLYQQSACALFKACTLVNWRAYGLEQNKNALPIGPLTLSIHLASPWPPFTNEAKEAVANYDEIIKEAKLALQQLGRELAIYINKKYRIKKEEIKRSYIEKNIPIIAEALKEIVGFTSKEEERLKIMLKELLEKHRGKIEKLTVENLEYDPEFARIGKENESEE